MKLLRLACTFTLLAVSALGDTTSWNGLAGNRDWADSGNWSGSVPGNGDTAQIGTGADVLISSSSAGLAALEMSGGTLTFTNWNTILTATNITITGGTVALPGAFTNNSGASNRVYFACTNFFLGTNGLIDVSKKGFMGGQNSTSIGNFHGQGPGGGRNSSSGGGHGGKGGRWTYPGLSPSYGWDYDSVSAPLAPGSGGGADSTSEPGGHGGGVVRIDASRSVVVNGVIDANGQPHTVGDHRGGWGSGGSVYITCHTFAGTNGVIRAEGGKHYQAWGGAGGGGRIAIDYNPGAQAAMPKSRVTLSSKGGQSSTATETRYNGDPGTIYLPDTTVLDPTWLPHNGCLYFDNAVTSWSVDTLTATNGWLWISQTNMTIIVTNDLLVGGSGVHLETPVGATVHVGGNLIVTNSAEFSVHAGETNSPMPGYSSLVSVTGDVVVASGAAIYPWSEERNGGSVLFRAANLRVDSGGSIDADGKGYRGGWYSATGYTGDGYGPGGGKFGTTTGAGGGYGGAGNPFYSYGGSTYGTATNPIHPGSGGGARVTGGTQGGKGGGLFRVELTGNAIVNGTITANGQYVGFGGGSGGGVLIDCAGFSGSGAINANGSDAATTSGGGGGGGRIAVHYTSATPGVTFSAAPGRGPYYQNVVGAGLTYYYAELGSVYLSDASLVPYTNVLGHSGMFHIPGFSSWSVESLVLTNDAYIGFATNGFVLTVTNDLRGYGGKTKLVLATDGTANVGGDCTAGVDLREHAKLTVGGDMWLTNHYDWGSWLYAGAELRVGGDLILTNAPTVGLENARLRVQSGPTNGVTDHGALVAVTGTLAICSNAWLYSYSDDAFSIYPYSGCTNGGSPLYRVGNLEIGPASGINAAGTGWRRGGPTAAGWSGNGYGPGGGIQSTATAGGGGGGYGGKGGDDAYAPRGGVTYGLTNAPMQPGSGSGPRNGTTASGVEGGGYIRIVATNSVTLDGTITVNGKNLASYGGGSGGGIWIDCSEFSGGASGHLQANGGYGGAASAGGGGGGRIAVWYGNLSASARANLLAGQDHLVPLLQITDDHAGFQGLAEVEPGTGKNSGETGTVVFVTVAGAGPTVDNRLATNVTSGAASLNGYLVATGGASATVSVLWGDSDGADTLAAWANTNVFPGLPDVGPLATNVAVSPNTITYYRYYADNGAGTSLAPTTSVFSTYPVTIAAPAPNADEDGQVPGTVTVYRAGATTNFPLTVYYSVTGSAINGSDYYPIASNLTMDAGVSNATVVIAPITDGDTGEGPETAVLTLYGDTYVVGAMDSATVTIADLTTLATSNRWVGGAGNWTNAASWSEGYVPVAGQHVTVTGSVSLSDSTDPLGVLRITNGALTVSDWTTRIEATNVWVLDGGVIDLPAAFTDDTVSNRVWIVCSNLTVQAGGWIDADEGGFSGGRKTALTEYHGQGPGGGVNNSGSGGGGGHGGKGGRWTYPGFTPARSWDYGSASAPETPGSGGGADNGSLIEPGGDGGGVVRIQASGLVTVNGTISSDGGDYVSGDHRGGFGSGGSIYISCDRFGGTNGVIHAEGGTHNISWGGGGGGGRIAVAYDVTAQAVMPKPRVTFSSLGGPDATGVFDANAGDNGTLHFTDATLLDPAWLPHNGVLTFPPAVLSWSPSSLLVSNGWLTVDQTNITIAVTGDILVTGSGTHLETPPGGTLSCAGDLVVSNSAELTIHSGATNGVVEYGSQVTVDGDLIVASGATLRSSSQSTNGASPFFTVRNLRVDAGGLVSADATGWRGGWYAVTGYTGNGYGPGGGTSGSTEGSGGGYGGEGGDSTGRPGGSTYGDSNAPVHPGSGGASRQYQGYQGGAGGGLFRLEAQHTITVDGTISANGGSTTWGGGSGGGIYLHCLKFQGAVSGHLCVEGANAAGNNGAGGGGRTAVWRYPAWDSYGGTHSEAGGVGDNDNGGVGTYTLNDVYLPQGSIFILR